MSRYEFNSELKLIHKAKRGDIKAFSELYAQLYQELYKFALYTMKHSQDAEDVVSEAVTDAFTGIRKLKREEAFSNWMYQIVANKCKRKMREYYREDILYEDIDMWDHSKEEHYEVRKAFMELSSEERMIIGLHLFFGYKTREIAQFMELNDNTVRSKESRAMKKLENKLKGLRENG